MKVKANTTTAMVSTFEVCARFQPNCFSNGATNMLQAYNVPRARFIDMPPITRHQRLMDVPDWNDCAVLAMRLLSFELRIWHWNGPDLHNPALPPGPLAGQRQRQLHELPSQGYGPRTRMMRS